jgi:hypothetical protein
MTKKFIKRAEADVGLIFTAYNLRRIINLLGINVVQSYFREALLIFFAPITSFKPKISLLNPIYFFKETNLLFSNLILESLTFG